MSDPGRKTGDPEIVLGLLTLIKRDSAITQCKFAGDLGIALGVSNSYLLRCVRKGLFKMSQVSLKSLCLLRQGYAAYVPRYRIQIGPARCLRSVLWPLFPRYLFAGIDRAAMRWRPILSTAGLSDLVHGGEEPMPVAPEIVEALHEQERAGAFDGVARRRVLPLGELIRSAPTRSMK